MALISLCSVKGSPGVSTTVAALGLAWPAPVVLADLDANGGDLALRYEVAENVPMDPERGLISLAAGVRRDAGSTRLEEHLQRVEDTVDVLAGLRRAQQVAALGPVWLNLARALAAADRDVIADCGRVAPSSPVLSVLGASDLVVVLVRPVLEELFHLRERVEDLGRTVTQGDGTLTKVAIGLIAPPHDGSLVADVRRTLQAAGIGYPVLDPIADDPKAAARLRYRLGDLPRRSALARSAGQLAEQLHELAHAEISV